MCVYWATPPSKLWAKSLQIQKVCVCVCVCVCVLGNTTVESLGQVPAARTCRVHVGFKVLTVNGMPPSGTDALSGDVKSDNAVTVTFARPPLDIPPHGSARKSIHKPVQHVILPEQLAWLKANVFADGKSLLQCPCHVGLQKDASSIS